MVTNLRPHLFQELTNLTDSHPTLPLESECIEIPLTADQIELLSPMLILHRCHDQAVIFAVATNSFVASAGRPVARLQLKICDRKSGARVMKILREAKL
jgi:hypothetical protein